MIKYVTEEILEKKLKEALDAQTKLIIGAVDQRINNAIDDQYLKIKNDIMQFKDDIITEYRKVDLEQTMLVGRVADHEARLEKIEDRFAIAN